MLRNHHAKKKIRQETIWSKPTVPFDGATIDVAQRLIGALLVRKLPDDESDGGTEIVARIVETEAYLPMVDPSCHAYRGPTKRNASIFGRAGTAYVYFIYGNHFCLNVVTERAGIGAAVLIRAAEPLTGVEAMRKRRPGVSDARLASGPGNLCKAMSIDRRDDGTDLASSNLRIALPDRYPRQINAGPRIGLSVAQDWPLRFFDPDSDSISANRRGTAVQSPQDCAHHLVDGHARSML